MLFHIIICDGGLGWMGDEIVVLKCSVWIIDGLSVSAIHMDMSGNTYYIHIKYILYSYMKGFGQVRFNFDDIWQHVNFDVQRVSEQTGKLSGGPRVFDPRVCQIFRTNSFSAPHVV